MATFLVTGGAGFIGSHLCRALLGGQHRVRVLDDLSTGCLANLPGGVEFIRGDIGDPEIVGRALEGVSGCYHLAAIASVERGERDWLGSHRTNLTGTIVVLDAIRRRRTGRAGVPFVYASSAAVYGDSTDLPLAEATQPRPLSAYGADKHACELHAGVATLTHGISTIGLRFFNVYGPRQDPRSPYSGVISIFCDRMLRGEPVTIYGDGQQTRDFVYVDDVVQALLGAMRSAAVASAPAAFPPVLNVCTGAPVSIRQLLRTVEGLSGRPAQAFYKPPRAGEVRASLGSPRLLRQTLGISGSTPLRVGLEQVLSWMKQERRAA